MFRVMVFCDVGWVCDVIRRKVTQPQDQLAAMIPFYVLLLAGKAFFNGNRQSHIYGSKIW